MERSEIETKLLENTCKVVFEKVDGSERVMICTLKKDLLPDVAFVSKSEQKRLDAQNVVKVFDLEKKEWRAFRIDKIKSFEIQE